MTTLNESVSVIIIFADNTTLSVSESEITGNFSISSRAVSGTGFEIGAVCSSQLTASFIIPSISNYDIFGAKIIPTVTKNNISETLGVFNVTSADKYRDIITVSASDNLIWMNKSAFYVDENNRRISLIAEYLSSSRSVYQLLKYVTEDICGLELSQSQSVIEAMPNGSIKTIVFEDVKSDCPLDWLSWICEALGGYAYTDSAGKIAVGHFEKFSSETISNEIQNDSLTTAGFTMHLSKIEMDVWDGSYGAYYTIYDNQPNTIYVNLSDNPIVQGKHYLYGNAMDILAGISYAVDIPYHPFTAIVHTDKMLRIGQCVSVRDYDNTYFTTVITCHTWSLNNGQKIQCAGSDCRLLSDSKKRSALKRESEKIRSIIENSKGKSVTESEMQSIIESGKYKEGDVFYVYEDETE